MGAGGWAPKIIHGPPDSGINGNHLPVVFTSFESILESESDGFNFAQAVLLSVPIEVAKGKRVLGFVQENIFGILRTAGTRIVISADLGGKLHTLEYGFETPIGSAEGGTEINKSWRAFSP